MQYNFLDSNFFSAVIKKTLNWQVPTKNKLTCTLRGKGSEFLDVQGEKVTTTAI
jgi:hypothetical protein